MNGQFGLQWACERSMLLCLLAVVWLGPLVLGMVIATACAVSKRARVRWETLIFGRPPTWEVAPDLASRSKMVENEPGEIDGSAMSEPVQRPVRATVG